MAFSDVLRILIGRKTAAERAAEERFQNALRTHKNANGEVKALADKLQKASADVHARIDALSAGGSRVEGRGNPQESVP